MTGFGTAFAVYPGVFNSRGLEFWSVQADIAVRTEKNRTVMHGDDTSLVWFRGIATPIRF